MRLYTEKEICGGCVYAVFYDCGNCLKRCLIGEEDNRSFVGGSCREYREEENTLKVKKGEKKMRGPRITIDYEDYLEMKRKSKEYDKLKTHLREDATVKHDPNLL